jgi:hypothetical protein
LRDFFDGVFEDFRLDESDGVAIGAAFVTTGVGCWAWMDGWHGHVDRYGSRLILWCMLREDDYLRKAGDLFKWKMMMSCQLLLAFW